MQVLYVGVPLRLAGRGLRRETIHVRLRELDAVHPDVLVLDRHVVTGEADHLPGGGPQKVGIAAVDVTTGMYATIAVLAALNHRSVTERGQYIDTALLDCVVALGGNQVTGFFASGKIPKRYGNAPGILAARRGLGRVATVQTDFGGQTAQLLVTHAAAAIRAGTATAAPPPTASPSTAYSAAK